MDNQEFDYTKVPKSYVHCLHEACTCHDKCLRFLAAKYAPGEAETYRCVNPNAVPADGTPCPFYASAERVRMAWGTSRLLDSLPYATALAVNRAVRALYPRTTYHRIRHHEQPILPEVQKKIEAIFARYGVETPPQYDCVTEEFRFD